MTEKEIIEGNKLIAEFMQMPLTKQEVIFSINTGQKTKTVDAKFKFHQSWDWLMPVVEKIESLMFSFYIHNDGAYIRKTHYKGNFPDLGRAEESKIIATWLTIIDFITWYNSNPHK